MCIACDQDLMFCIVSDRFTAYTLYHPQHTTHSILVNSYFMVSLLSHQPHMLVDSGTFDMSEVLTQRNSGSRWGCRSTPQSVFFIGYSRFLAHLTKA
jgi:hypothetical protein